jgi:hypothetical protein
MLAKICEKIKMNIGREKENVQQRVESHNRSKKLGKQRYQKTE